MPAKRKATTPAHETPPAKVKKGRDGSVSTLIPVGPRLRAIKGRKNEAMLHMLCDDTKTGKQKELHFKKIVHAQIDWNSAEDIAKINSWRNQLYGRAGRKAKTVVMWHEEEENWLELYYHLLIIEATKHGLMIPRVKDVLKDFNLFFEGKILDDADGEELDPRKPRAHNAFVSKMNRVIGDLKNRLEQMLMGKSGDFYRPKITAGMLEKFKEMKDELVEQDAYEEMLCYQDVNDSEKNSRYLAHFEKFLANLPPESEKDGKDVEMKEEDGDMIILGLPTTIIKKEAEEEKEEEEDSSTTSSLTSVNSELAKHRSVTPAPEAAATSASSRALFEGETTLVADDTITKIETDEGNVSAGEKDDESTTNASLSLRHIEDTDAISAAEILIAMSAVQPTFPKDNLDNILIQDTFVD